MGDIPRIGPVPVPDDENLSEFIKGIIQQNHSIVVEKLGELGDTVRETLSENQPKEFAYAKLLNYLSAQDTPELIHLCAASLWKLYDIPKVWRNDGT